ncbi:MAG: redoxin domain-containing protein [Bacteroidetes bacterium]|nr:redoxin domain-containing protein [Bacteroidota bacterium]
MKQFLTLVTLLLAVPAIVFSQKVGYQIKVKIDGFDQKEAYLGYYFGDKQYLKDTAYVEADGKFYFEGNEKLAAGMYLIVLPPDNQFVQLLVDDDNQWFSVETKLSDLAGSIKVTGSEDNKRFYDYLKFISDRRPKADDLRKQLEEAKGDEKKKAKLEEKIKVLDEEVMGYQKDLVAKYPKSMTARVIKANMPLDPPKFEGEEKERDLKAFYWMREHWFDNLDLSDPKMVRTPFLFPKVNHYVEKMTVQHPDSIIISVDKVLKKMQPAEENFKFYLIHFLNEYAKANIVGMDAVYVHIAQKYYKTGLAPWTDEDQLKKIIENADRLDPLLIGKVAPNIEMQTQKGDKIWLHDFKSPLTVLFFWDPDCGHCKKAMPEMVKFAKDYKDKGVAVFSICTSLATRDDEGNLSLKEVDKCWSAIEERDMNVFFNTVDPYHRSRYKAVYDIKTTPQIYVLDADKTILSKRLGADQLPEVIDHILQAKKDKAGG